MTTTAMQMEVPAVGSVGVAVEACGLTMQYGSTTVLDDVSFSLPAGQTVALLGPNGAGKSTLIEIMEGLRRPSAGTIRTLGEEPATAPQRWRSRLGIVLQAWRDHGTWRVRDLLEYVSAAHAAADVQDLWDIDELIEAVGLKDQANQRLNTLSGGQRRRVDVAVALVSKPELIFLDEPTTGFDPEARQAFYALVRSLAVGTTILWATHDLAEAESVCDRVVILANGQVAVDDTVEGLRARLSAQGTVTWNSPSGPVTRTLEDTDTLVRDLVRSGVPFSELEVRRGSFEAAYLAIVGRDQNEGE